MAEIKRKWDLLGKEEREIILKQIITFYKTQRSEEIGIIAAGEILDFFLQNVGAIIHNKTIEKTKEILMQNFENTEVDLDLLLDK